MIGRRVIDGRRLIAAAALAAALAIAPAALGQTVSILTLVGGSATGGRPLSSTEIPFNLTGALTVSFHGDPSTGCALRGLCGYSGTLDTSLPSGELEILTYRAQGRVGHDATLLLLGFGGFEQQETAAEVEREIDGQQAGLCGDASSSQLPVLKVPTTGDSLTFTLLTSGGTLLQTRCAGPLDGDLVAFAPTVTLPISVVLRGHTRIDLSGTRAFAADGFAGTLSSTVVLGLGSPQRESSGNVKFPPGIKTQKTRLVTQQLTVTRVAGSIGELVTGLPDTSLCLGLDSCGLTGSLMARPVPYGASGELEASGPASRPYRDFLRALGDASSGRAAGITVYGTADWQDRGTVTATTNQSGVCTDTAPLGGGDLSLGVAGGVMSAFYQPQNGLRTRCPGPIAPPDSALAVGAASIRAVDRGTFTLGLHAAGPFEDDGYGVRPQGHLSITLRRGATTQQVMSVPTG